LLARRARRGDRGTDSAAGAGDLLVSGAAEAQLELVRAVAAIDEMRVAIDEARGHPAAGEVVHLARDAAGIAGQIRHRPEPGDAAVLDGECRALDRAIGRAAAAHGPKPPAPPPPVPPPPSPRPAPT